MSRCANQGVRSDSATASATTAGSGASPTRRSPGTGPRPSSTPTVTKNGALTATKSQSKSTTECRRYAPAATTNANAAACSCPANPRTLRNTPNAAAATEPSASKKPTTPVSDRNCSGTLCGSVTTMLFERRSRCASSKLPAPVPPSGCSVNAFHASVHHCQRLVELIVVSRVGPTICDVFVGACENSRNHPWGFDSATSASTAAAAPTASTASATRPTNCRRASASGRCSSASDPRYARAATTTAPSTNTNANHAPSCTRGERGCRSSASPGRENAHTATATPAPPPSSSAAAPSSRGPPSASQAATATSATATPPRE